MEGNDVKELQSLLIQAGYSCGSYGADGDFGDATENAVRELQKDSKINGLRDFLKSNILSFSLYTIQRNTKKL